MPERHELPSFDERWVEKSGRAMGLARLNPAWAKLEILIGLAAAAAGVKLLGRDGMTAFAGAALFVLGGYLAMAGNRSHLYQSQNRQTAYLLQTLLDRKEVAESKESPDG